MSTHARSPPREHPHPSLCWYSLLNFTPRAQETSEAWTEIAEPVASPPLAVASEGPTVGPIDLGPSAGTNESLLPPLAIVIDAEAIHRGMATRLASRGFPLAWYCSTTYANDSTGAGVVGNNKKTGIGGFRLPGAQARTPRHAAEIASYLPRNRTTTPHHASPTKTSSTLRALETLALGEDAVVGMGSPPGGGGHDGGSYGREDYASRYNDINSGDGDGDVDVGHHRLLMLVAVSGDAALDAALERLLAGERAASSAYVDRNLLAGAVLVLNGPMSETAVGRAARRCKRAGVSLIVMAIEGTSTDARGGALHVWVASESGAAVHMSRPLLRALAATAEVVSSNPRDACSARLARAVVAGRRRKRGNSGDGDDDGTAEMMDGTAAANAAAANAAAALRASGAAAAAVAAERRAMALERQLQEARGAAERVATLEADAAASADRALEADTRAVQAMESNAALRLDLERARDDLEELVAVCNLMDEQLRDASESLQEAKTTKLRLEELEGDSEAKEAALGRVADLEAELVTRFEEVRAARAATDQTRAELEEERAARSAAVNSGYETQRALGDLTRRNEELEAKLAVAATDAEWHKETKAKLEASEEQARVAAKNAEEACDQRDDARRDARDARAEVEKLEKMRAEWELQRQRLERELEAARAAVETAARGEAEATRRSEKLEDEMKRLDAELTTTRVDAAAAEAAMDRARNELESTKSALVVANARRDSEVALAREASERSSASAVAAADAARADAESRARKASDQLIEATERADRESNRARTLSGELAAALDDAKLARAGATNVSALEAQLTGATETNARLTNDVARLEKVIAEAHSNQNAVVTAATSAAEHALERARADTATSEKARMEAEAAGFRAAAEVSRMAERMRQAEAARVAAEAAAERARQELAAERTAGAAAHSALADIGAETARLASEIDAARGMQARWAAGKQATRDAAALEEADRLTRALAAAEASRGGGGGGGGASGSGSAGRSPLGGGGDMFGGRGGAGGEIVGIIGGGGGNNSVPGSAASAARSSGVGSAALPKGWRTSPAPSGLDSTPRSPLFGSYSQSTTDFI